VPFIHSHCAGRVPIVASGASFGALHAANTLFRRPDLIDGCIAMSGVYDLKEYTQGYWDEDVYFNSPIDYLPNLTDEAQLSQLRGKRHIYFVSGRGAYEKPAAAHDIGRVLSAKGIPHEVDLWGPTVNHDWPWWRLMLPHYLGARF
jgi:esterase/lipase superfamily enzyme